jgi:hypothetical protein
MPARASTLAIAAALLPGVALGHEFWIQPDEFHPAPGAQTPVRCFVGERFRGEELPWRTPHAADFRHLSPGGEEAVRGEDGATPAAWVRFEEAGVHVLAYRSHASPLTLPADAFNAYLLDDGLYAPLAARRAAGACDRPGRERYARYAKAAVVCGGGATSSRAASQPVGHRLELVPDTDLAALAAGAPEIALRVLFESAPLAGAVVFAAPAARPEEGLRRTLTDGQGRCRFALDSTGPWMVSLVHMIACSGCSDADWDSSWATLVFWRGGDGPGFSSPTP